MPAETKGVIHVLTGCTAVGKTEAALAWAEAAGAEIINCDSLLFYRGMDIGTAKPSRAELARVPHALIDILEPTEQMDIGRYLELARREVLRVTASGRPVLVTGGSGFYLKAFFAPVVDDVAVPEGLRATLLALSPEECLSRLKTLNPGGLGKLDTANPRRVLRALERCLASGRTLEDLAKSFAAQPAPFQGWQLKLLRLDREPADLAARIEKRISLMLEAGLVEEVRRLRKLGFESNPSAARAIGYREVLAMFDGKLEAGALATEIAANTRALVKKQRTWFRTQLPAHRVLHPSEARTETLFEGIN